VNEHKVEVTKLGLLEGCVDEAADVIVPQGLALDGNLCSEEDLLPRDARGGYAGS